MRTRPRLSINQQLILFSTALLTPVLLVAAVLLWTYAASERARYREDSRDAAHRIMAAIDRELTGMMAVAQVLASSEKLIRGEYEQFQQRGASILRQWSPERSGDYAIVVRDKTSQQVVNTRLPWGSPLPKGTNLSIDQQVIAAKRAFIQDLFVGATSQHPIISVRVPVLNGDEVTHVLSLAVTPARLAEVIEAQKLPTSWIGTLIDRNDRVVARSREHETFVGSLALATASGGADGFWEGKALDGILVQGAYARSSVSGWRVFVGVPQAVAQTAVRRSLWAITVFGLGLILLSLLIALWFTGRIAKPVRELANSARLLGRGEPVSPFTTGIIEFDEVAAAHATASIQLREREAALKQSEMRLQATQDNAAVGIVEVDREGRFVAVNEARCRLTGHTREELLGMRFCDNTHENDLEQDIQLFRQQVAGLCPMYTIEKHFYRKDGSHGWARVWSTAVRDASGAFQYAVRVVEDITAQKQAEDRQNLLIGELNHRVKNTLATIQSLLAQSFRRGMPPETGRERFEARLLALSRTHNLLNESSWEGARLTAILLRELEPYGSDGTHFRLFGDDVFLPANQAVVLGMVLHELTTNAVKYGALSTRNGRVEVAWETRIQQDEAVLEMSWRESGGPQVDAPGRNGFGSRLIRQAITGELAGSLDARFAAEGVSYRFAIPVGRTSQSPRMGGKRMQLQENKPAHPATQDERWPASTREAA